MAAGTDLKRTPLYDQHVAAGARLVDFAGWEMPVQYEGVKEEHLAVRGGAGMFDVSHMGQVKVQGLDADAYLNRAISNDVTKVPLRGAQYSVLCNEDGGVLDDLFAYREEDGFLVVTNASNHDRDFATLRERAAGFDEVEVTDVAAEWAMIAVQGPTARAAVEALVPRGELPARMTTTVLDVAGCFAMVCGTGYTGEDGVELLVEPEDAGTVWDALLAQGVVPCGLGARDTLRTEACFHLYGNDLSEDRDPISAGLGWACKEATGFVGAERIAEIRAAGPAETLVPFAITDRGIARGGNPVLGGGVVTSGTMSPVLGIGVGLAYLPTERSAVGTSFEIDVRGRVRTAEVRNKPLHKP